MEIPQINSETLKAQNKYELTKARIKKFTMADLKEVLEAMDESDAILMVNAIKESRWDKAASVLEFLTFTKMQEKVEK